MASGKSINLFDTKASLTPGWILAEKYLILLRQYFLGFILIAGILLVGTYGIVRLQKAKLDREEQQLATAIQSEHAKEGLLLALRARIASLKKILDVQLSVAPYIDTTLLLARPPRLTSFSIGDKNTVQISVELPDIGEAVSMMEVILQLVSENKIRNANLTSLTINKDGSVMMGIMYQVVLKPAL